MINIIPWSENGYKVTGSSSDPIKACAEIIKDKPDVVFCDLKMPGLSGIELIKKLNWMRLRSYSIILIRVKRHRLRTYGS